MVLMTLWESQVELNNLFVDGFKLLGGRVIINHVLIIIIIVWLLILTYKLFKKQQKQV